MSNQFSYKTDLNELIFANKNKEYGAYKLRKKYKAYLTIAMWTAIVLFVLGTAAPIILSKLTPKEDLSKLNRKKIVQITDLAEPPSIDKKQEIQQQVEAPPPLKSTIKFLPPVVKPDEQVTEEYIPTVEELHDVDPGAKTQEGQEGGIDYSLIEVQETKEEIVEPEEKKEEAFSYVEEMPSYPGGEEALMQFIYSNVQYPEIAKRAGVEGKVFVSFVVEKNGSITEVRVAKGIGAGCDEEAVRVVRMMPGWKPGKQNGKSVRVRVLIPFTFKLN